MEIEAENVEKIIRQWAFHLWSRSQPYTSINFHNHFRSSYMHLFHLLQFLIFSLIPSNTCESGPPFCIVSTILLISPSILDQFSWNFDGKFPMYTCSLPNHGLYTSLVGSPKIHTRVAFHYEYTNGYSCSIILHLNKHCTLISSIVGCIAITLNSGMINIKKYCLFSRRMRRW